MEPGSHAATDWKMARNLTRRRWQQALDRLEEVQRSAEPVEIISGQKFVAAFARQHRLHVVSCKARNEMQRNAGEICKRLITAAHHFGQKRYKSVTIDDDFVVLGADMCR